MFALVFILGNVIDDAVMHDPFLAIPVGKVSILYMLYLAVRAKFLQRHALQLLRLGIKETRISQTLHLALGNLLDNDVFLTLHGRVALNLVVEHIAVGRICPRNHVFIEGNRPDADNEAKDKGGHGNTGKADAAGLHGRYLTVAGQAAEGQKCRQQHGHRKSPHNDTGQAKDEDFDNRLQRSAIIRYVLSNPE